MNEEILNKLERRVDRRSFLRGSGLVAVGIVGLAAASPVIASAQEKPQDEKKQENRKPDDQKQDEKKDGNKEDTKQDNAATDPYKVTRLDENGRDYRVCPVCGSNMYRQDHTWTCENCGYTYEE